MWRLPIGADSGRIRGRKMAAADGFFGHGILLAFLEQLSAILAIMERLKGKNQCAATVDNFRKGLPKYITVQGGNFEYIL